MAEHQERFAETVIAEMRGISDEEGRSPFWNWLEEHFFSMDFPTADYLTGIGKKVFIAELMPKHPIYVNLLSKDAQKVINEVHPKTLPALRLLEAEGFSRRGYVDIFDGGPTVEAQTAKVKTIRNSGKYQVIIGDTDDTVNFIICNTKVAGFRAVQAKVSLRATAEQVVIPSDIAEALQVNEGDFVRLVRN